MNASFLQCMEEERMTCKVAQLLGLHICSLAGSEFKFMDLNLVMRYATYYQYLTDQENCWE